MTSTRTLLLVLAITAGFATSACTTDQESDESDDSTVQELIDLAGEVEAGEVPYRPNICEWYDGCAVCDDGICYGYACYCDADGCADSGGGCY